MNARKLLAIAGCAVALGAGAAAQTVQINGAGATFPYPIYSKWFSEYNKLHPNVQINYQSIGSGGGIRQVTNQTVFFGATDGPMTNDQQLAAPGKILHFPTVLGAVVPVYNIPGVTAELKFTRPGARGHLPRQDHEVERPGDRQAEPRRQPAGDRHHRGAPVRRIGHDLHLGGLPGARCPTEWKTKVGVATAVNWPTGVGGKGNEGVAGLVTQTPGSIGYVELIYALQNKISYGSVQNMAGEFVRATVQSVTARGGGRGGEDAGRLPGVDHERRRQGRLSRSRRSPGCCSTKARRTRSSRRRWSTS